MSVNHAPPVVYDVTRLVTRGLNLSPNGIDRVDFALARHFLSKGATPLICTALGPRLSDREKALSTIDAIENYWREDSDAEQDAVYSAVVAALRGDKEFFNAARYERKPGFERLLQYCHAIREWAFALGRPVSAAPRGAIYFSATQFLLDRPWYVGWLNERRDVKLIAFVHDLLPVDHPEFFRPTEAKLHPRRLWNMSQFAAGVVAGSHEVETRFQAFAAAIGRPEIPVCVARLPVSPTFSKPVAAPDSLAGVDYFVICGTIEPRKNHVLLLNVWRELALRGEAPKLVVVGKRGWLFEEVVHTMAHSPLLHGQVIEAAGLSTPGLRSLMAGARALLMPSLGEGFGLPVSEALVSGVPVIASDLSIFREIGGEAPDYLEPCDHLGWLQAIQEYASPDSRRRAAAMARLAEANNRNDLGSFFETVDKFIERI